VCDESLIDTQAEESGKLLVDILTATRRWKTAHKVHANFRLSRMIITAGEEERASLEPIADDLQAAAHAASLEFGEGGDIPTEVENITLRLVLGEEKSQN
jgi:valyl-tRNA synthetase